MALPFVKKSKVPYRNGTEILKVKYIFGSLGSHYGKGDTGEK